jgi:5'-nucleotidase
MKDSKPSIILSGINCGGNPADEVNMSGTLGAAFTGLMFGVPSIAVSQVFTVRNEIKWGTARQITPRLLRHFLVSGWHKDTCLSINIPDLPPEQIKGYAWTRQGQGNITGVKVDERKDHRDKNYYWLKLLRQEAARDGNDLAILQRGDVAVTALSLNRSVDVEEAPVTFDHAYDR